MTGAATLKFPRRNHLNRWGWVQMASEGPSEIFETGRVYKGAYLLFLDAAGYSTIVSANPLDRAALAFNLLRERAMSRLDGLARRLRCARAELWAWRGDGGFFVLHDDDESVARDVAILGGRSLIDLDLRHLREEFAQLGISGELHLRVAVHRGVFHYVGDHHVRSLHSVDINLAAHLEEATPPDMLSISEDVHRVAGPHGHDFLLAGEHEGRRVYLRTGRTASPGQDPAADARLTWLTHHGPPGWEAVHTFPERPSQRLKAELVDLAAQGVVDLGTALNTCSHYLLTTERPAPYRDAVLSLLRRGGFYHCIVLDPKSAAAEHLADQRQEDIPLKITRSVDRLAEFRHRHEAWTERFHVYQTASYPGFHALAVDVDTARGLILYSPYLAYTLPAAGRLERGDMPHYLVTAGAQRHFRRMGGLVAACRVPETLHRIV